MIWNYFKAAWRNLTKNKGFSFINITGLAIGMAAAILILLWIQHEMVRDTQYPKSDRLYMMYNRDKFSGQQYAWNSTPMILGPTLRKDYPEVDDVVRVRNNAEYLFTVGEKKLMVHGYFMKVMGTRLVEGRDIDLKEYPGDSNAILLNETAVKRMRLKEPVVGQFINNGNDSKMQIVGVVKDFIFGAPYEPISPLMINGPGTGWFNVIHMKLNPAKSVSENLKLVEQVFKQYNPQYPFSYKFVDDEYASKFENARRTATLAALFAGLTIFISCLGLFGLATYTAENRIKEIGVRKVLGASVMNISTLLSKDFLKLVIISFLIASPIAWYAMH